MTPEEIIKKQYILLKECVKAYDEKDFDNPIHEEHSKFYKEHKTIIDKYKEEVIKPNIQNKLKLILAKK